MSNGIILGAWSSAFTSGGSGPANGYTHGNAITIAHGQVPANQTAFPVVVYGTLAYLADVAHSGFIQNTTTLNTQTVPADLIFTSDLAGVTLLNWEVASWVNTSGAIEVWINTPLSSTVDTVIYMWYGKTSVTTYQGNATSVWDANYKGVYHFANGSSLSLKDSTSNANNGTSNNGPTATTGIVDGGMATTGGIGNVAPGSTLTSVVGASAPVTASAWLYPTNSANENAFLGGTNSNGDFEIRKDSGRTISVLKSGIANNATTAGTLTLNTWNFVGVAVDSSNNINIYINGNAVETFAGAFTALNGINAIGYETTGDHGWIGTIDEVHLSNTNRSSNWLATEYNNQSSPGTFYTIGSQI